MIKVGITEYHGISKEYAKCPPSGVEYTPIKTSNMKRNKVITSNAKGVYDYVLSPEHDIIEAPLFPVVTKQPWIYTPAHFSSAGNFNLLGLPTPRSFKQIFFQRFYKQSNLKKIIFKSHHGLESLYKYGNIQSEKIIDKSTVVYPAIRRIEDTLIFYKDTPTNILFVGEFVRKGGCNVVDAFERIQKHYPELNLILCTNLYSDLENNQIISPYIERIKNNPSIQHGYVSRETLLSEILPNCDIYLCPTYQEAWGFSIQEAMAYGKPIITTDISAIPEMIGSTSNAEILEIKNTKYIKNLKGYYIDSIPKDFKESLTDMVYQSLKRLLASKLNREKMGQNALRECRTRFSFDARNEKMSQIYHQSV